MTTRAEKDAAYITRACLARERTHLRVGTWRGPDIDAVTLVGHAADLHGPDGVCTCCPRREKP